METRFFFSSTLFAKLTFIDHEISCSRYGKDGVRLLHVSRSDGMESIRELEVSTRLTLSDVDDYTLADNSRIIATDSQKNIIYILAKKYGVRSPEELAMRIAGFLVEQYSQVKEATVTVSELRWDRVDTGTGPHRHAFSLGGGPQRWTEASHSKQGERLKSGFRELRLLKTTKSSFTNFVRDEFRTLADADDRIFSTRVTAEWTYNSTRGLDLDAAWKQVVAMVTDEFAGPREGKPSPSVQHTLYLACAKVLAALPQVDWVEMDMPNCHYLNLDLSMFPKELVGDTPNREVFLPIDKPAGFIHAALKRTSTSKL